MSKASRIVIASVAVGFVAACSSSDGSSSSSSSSGDPNNASSSGDPNNASGASERSQRCSGELTANSCQDCCGYTDELAFVMVDAVDECACAGACKTQCGSTGYCSSSASGVSAECNDCLPTCNAKGDEVCKADPLCKAYGECTLAAECEKKKGGLQDPDRR